MSHNNDARIPASENFNSNSFKTMDSSLTNFRYDASAIKNRLPNAVFTGKLALPKQLFFNETSTKS